MRAVIAKILLEECVQAQLGTAFLEWSARKDEGPQRICATVTARIEEHAGELATIITLEQGKPLNGLGVEFAEEGLREYTDIQVVFG